MTDSDRILRLKLPKSRFFDLERFFSIRHTPLLFHYSTQRFPQQRKIEKRRDISPDNPRHRQIPSCDLGRFYQEFYRYGTVTNKPVDVSISLC